MMDEVFIVCIVFYFIYLMLSLFARRKERMMLIEKISELKDVKLSNIHLDYANKYAWLHVGCCLCGVGLGILVAFFIELNVASSGIIKSIDYSISFSHSIYPEYAGIGRSVAACYSACICLFGGIGLVASFITANKLESKKNKEQ